MMYDGWLADDMSPDYEMVEEANMHPYYNRYYYDGYYDPRYFRDFRYRRFRPHYPRHRRYRHHYNIW